MFVGRVGALAVALGIGSAVFGSPALTAAARADSTPCDSSAGDPAGRQTSSPPGPSASDPHGTDDGGDTSGPGGESATPAGSGDDDAAIRPGTRPRDEAADLAADPKTDPDPVRPGADAQDSGGEQIPETTDVVLTDGGPADSLKNTPDPVTPVREVAEAAILAVSRRELIDADENDGAQKKMPPPAASKVNSLTLQRNSSPRPEAAPAQDGTAQIPVTPTPGYEKPADWESAYTGQPSFLEQVVVTGLIVVQAVAKFFGIPFSVGSGAPIPYFNDGTPPTFLMFGTDVTKEQYVDVDSGATWDEWIITPKAPSGKRVIALHGGAFITETTAFNFFTYNALATSTGATVVVPVYPVISKGGTAATVVPVTANLISSEVLTHSADNVSVLADSAGGNLGLAALELLAARIRNGQAPAAAMPGRLVLLSPGLDSNDPIDDIPFPEAYLDVPAIREANVAWMQGLDPTDPLGSPIYGSLEGLPPTTVYSSSMDSITFQTLRLREKAAAEHNTNFTFVLRKGLLHDWTVWFFLSDAQADWPGIYAGLGLTSGSSVTV